MYVNIVFKSQKLRTFEYSTLLKSLYISSSSDSKMSGLSLREREETLQFFFTYLTIACRLTIEYWHTTFTLMLLLKTNLILCILCIYLFLRWSVISVGVSGPNHRYRDLPSNICVVALRRKRFWRHKAARFKASFLCLILAGWSVTIM